MAEHARISRLGTGMHMKSSQAPDMASMRAIQLSSGGGGGGGTALTKCVLF